ncbi:MAG: tRNA (adenosine(37)-N6)-dimethylallyltransferase MiaA [Candidatus Latescibacterota bacterium]
MDLVAVCGPTASGKTRLGVELARRYGGEILSVDSRQVYRGLDLGTGKDLAEYDAPEGRVACHLIDIADPRQVYTLWRFLADFGTAVRAVRDRGHLPIAVGGTGLYLEAALRGYRVPDVAADPELRRALMGQPAGELAARLEALAPDLHRRTDLSSHKRIVRALEVALHVGTGPPARGPVGLPPMRALVLGVRWRRPELRQRIAERLDARLQAGLVEEVEGLLCRGVPPARLEELGMEYRHVARFLRGKLGREEMHRALLADIGRLAKRQETWFRGMERRGVPIHWVERAEVEQAAGIMEAWLRRICGRCA